MKVTLISHTPDADRLLVFTKSTRLNLSAALMDDINSMSHEKIRKELEYMSNTIPSSWEFVDYVFLVEGVSRAYTHQQVRSRAGSYAQQTMRINNMEDFDYIFTNANKKSHCAMGIIKFTNFIIKSAYRLLLGAGQLPEDARGILPTNISTNIICKFNLRTMAELCASRTGGRTQGEYISVVQSMTDEILSVHPWADMFLFRKSRDHFDELEKFAGQEVYDSRRNELLKIIDKMRKV